MHGTMLWFNEVKDHGFISTDEGERLYVHGTGFAGGIRPEGRCAGLDVSFELRDDGALRQAEECVLVDKAPGRRARLRRSAGRARL